MSFRGEALNGSNNGGSSGAEEWRDPFNDKSKVIKHTSTKRASKNFRNLDNEESFQEENDRDRYIITYADLITLLLGLFILLYASSNIDKAKYQGVIKAMGNVFGSSVGSGKGAGNSGGGIMNFNDGGQTFMTLKDKVKGIITDNSISDKVKLIENERGLTIRILDEILFPSGSAELTIYSKTILDKIAMVLKNIKNDLRIEGHTDNIPINSTLYPSNWHLSVNRATNTAYYLMNVGLPQDRVSVVGYAEFKPIESNETLEGRAQNRRVDVIILK